MEALLCFFLSLICHAQSTSMLGDDVNLAQESVEFKLRTTVGLYAVTEVRTCSLVGPTVQRLNHNIRRYIDIAFADVWDSLSLISDVRSGVCVNDTIAAVKENIDKEITNFGNVAQVTEVKLEGLTRLLQKNIKMFERKFITITEGLKTCYYQHPNVDQRERRDSCVRVYSDMFDRMGKDIALLYRHSPCMMLFTDEVLDSLNTTSRRLKGTTEELLNQLRCTGDNPEDKSCLSTLPHLPSFEPSLLAQVSKAQAMYSSFIEQVDTKINDYYKEEIETRKKYDMRPTSKEEFSQIINKTLNPNYFRLSEMLTDYPDERNCGCGKEATMAMADILHSTSHNATKCFEDTLTRVQNLMKGIQNNFVMVSQKLMELGNVHILMCIEERNTFAVNVIFDCYEAKFKMSTLSINKTLKSIKKKRSELVSLLPYLKDNGSTLECMEETLERAVFFSDYAMYLYHKCLEGCRLGLDKHSTTTSYSPSTYAYDTEYTSRIPHIEEISAETEGTTEFYMYGDSWEMETITDRFYKYM